jgi:hypothetical protein
MRRIAIATILMCSLTCLAAPASDGGAAWAKLQKLAGTWGKDSGRQHTLTFHLTSAGSVLMQTDEVDSMVTMYHLDKDRLMMTHYCAAKNQPRMTGEMSEDGKRIVFDFLDITNLAGPEGGHMRRMVLTFDDDDHITEEWTFVEKGKTMVEAFHYARKK